MTANKKKLIRITTIDGSLDGLLKGQLKFLNQYYDVVGAANDSGLLSTVAKREGIRTEAVKMNREISLSQDIKSLWNLVILFRKEKPYIVHANTPKGSLLAMIAAKITRVPHRIYTVTGLRFETTHGKLRTILKTMERITCMCANKIIPEGNGVKDTLICENITNKPLNVIHNGNINGIDISYFSPENISTTRNEVRNKLEISDEYFTFIFVGRIVRDKGMNELAEAMKLLNQNNLKVKLILVGNFESELDPILTENEYFFKNDESVIFVGYQNDIRPYLVAADALVFPSYREGFPNVVLQAGAMGLASIVTNINGCNEIIKENENGNIIPTKDTTALYNAMTDYIKDPIRVKNMKDKSREIISSKYNQSDVWNALLNEYRNL